MSSQIDALLAYVDDNFGHDANPDLSFYTLIPHFFPSKQVSLLELWERIGLPHERKKQEYSHSLFIIGFQVDTVSMTITLPDTK